MLELFGHPFVLRLYTTFQDANHVYFLTELLEAGELWSVIYESASGFESGNLFFVSFPLQLLLYQFQLRVVLLVHTSLYMVQIIMAFLKAYCR